MKPDAIVHIGVAKTGTTLLQKDLFTNTSFFYPLGRFGQGGDSCVDPSIRDLIWEGLLLDQYHWDKQKADYKNSMDSHIKEAQAEDRVAVISNEAISMVNMGQSDLKDRFERLAQLLPANTTCLILIREQLAWLKSMYSSVVCDGGATLSLQGFLDIQMHDPLNKLNFVASLDYNWLYNLAYQYFEQVEIIPFEAAFTADDSDSTIISNALSAPDFAPPEQKINASHTAEHIAKARGLNTRFPRDYSKPDEDIPNAFQRGIFRSALQKAQNREQLDGFETWLVNKTIAERRQKMLTLHDPKNLDKVCNQYGIKPLTDRSTLLESHKRWCRDTFTQSNQELAQQTGLDLAKYGYSL